MFFLAFWLCCSELKKSKKFTAKGVPQETERREHLAHKMNLIGLHFLLIFY